MICIVSSPKPFRDPHISLIQQNAIRSWMALPGAPTVILVGDEMGVSEFAAAMGLRHLSDVLGSSRGTPRLDDVFRRVRELFPEAIVCYVNADIILFPEFIEAVRRLMPFDNTLMLGARTDLAVTERVDFENPNWTVELRDRASREGQPMRISSDYFVFRHGAFDPMPAFLLGRPGYDNWMIWRARAKGMKVIDASATVLAIHQDHRQTTSWINSSDQSENRVNTNLMSWWASSYVLEDANVALTATGLESKWVQSIWNRVRLVNHVVYSRARMGAGYSVRWFRRCLTH